MAEGNLALPHYCQVGVEVLAPHFVWSPFLTGHLSSSFRACCGGNCPLSAFLSLPPSYKEKVTLITCVQFSTYFHASGTSDAKWERLSSKTSRKSSPFAHLKSITMLHRQGHIYSVDNSCYTYLQAPALGIPDPQVVDNQTAT